MIFFIGKNSRACIADAEKPNLSDYTKILDIYYRSLVDNIEKRKIIFHYVPTKDMIADVFTTNIGTEKFKTLCVC